MITANQIEVHPSDGLNQTILLLNHLEQLSLSKQDFITWVHRKFNNGCVECYPGKIWRYVKENFIYTTDEPFDELITAPYVLLQTKKGDCDDFSLFIKTCLDILGGWYTYYILFAKERGQWKHIAVYANRGRQGFSIIDPLTIDGANDLFNSKYYNYKYHKII